jgi:hypothetical protein
LEVDLRAPTSSEVSIGALSSGDGVHPNSSLRGARGWLRTRSKGVRRVWVEVIATGARCQLRGLAHYTARAPVGLSRKERGSLLFTGWRVRVAVRSAGFAYDLSRPASLLGPGCALSRSANGI